MRDRRAMKRGIRMTWHAKLVCCFCFGAGVLSLGIPGSASAMELCSTNTSPCTGTKYGVGTTISAQLKAGTSTVLTNSITNVKCTKSRFFATIISFPTPWGRISIPAVGVETSECHTSSGTSCTVTPNNLPWTGDIGASGGGNGSLSIYSGGTGNPSATVVCGFLINCTFSTAKATLSVTGGNPAIVKANGVPLERSGGFCPSTSNWDAEYEITSPKPIFAV